jgi:Fe-S-cluster containining protein
MTYDPSEIFTCQNCGECCKGYGGTYLSPKDVKAIAAFANKKLDAFIADYCEMSGGKPVLTQAESGYCIFWDGNCNIHSIKPRMCRAWPYIESVLHDVGNWHIMAASCPGMRTDVPESVIKACVEKELRGTHQGKQK